MIFIVNCSFVSFKNTTDSDTKATMVTTTATVYKNGLYFAIDIIVVFNFYFTRAFAFDKNRFNN